MELLKFNYNCNSVRKIVSIAVVLAMIVSDLSFAREVTRQTLAPPLATSPIVQVSVDSDGRPVIKTREDVIRYWDGQEKQTIQEGDILSLPFRKRWALRDIGLVIAEAMALGFSSATTISLLEDHLKARKGEKEVILEGFRVRELEQIPGRDEKPEGFQMPVERDGQIAYYLRFSFTEEHLSSRFTMVEVDGRDRNVFMSVVPLEAEPAGISHAKTPSPQETLAEKARKKETAEAVLGALERVFKKRDPKGMVTVLNLLPELRLRALLEEAEKNTEGVYRKLLVFLDQAYLDISRHGEIDKLNNKVRQLLEESRARRDRVVEVKALPSKAGDKGEKNTWRSDVLDLVRRDMKEAIKWAVHWGYIGGVARSEDLQIEDVKIFANKARSIASGEADVEEGIKYIKDIDIFRYDEMSHGDRHRGSITNILLLALLEKQRFDLVAKVADKCGIGHYDSTVTRKVPIYAEMLMRGAESSETAPLPERVERLIELPRPEMRDLEDLRQAAGEEKFTEPLLEGFLEERLSRAELEKDWTPLKEISDSDILVTAMWVLAGLRGQDRRFFHKETIQNMVYVRKKDRALFVSKKREPEGERYEGISSHPDRNSPVRELFAAAVGRAIGANVAETVVTGTRVYSKMAIGMDPTELPAKTFIEANSAAFVLNVLLRRWDDSVDMVQRSRVGNTFIGFDFDRAFHPDNIKMTRFLAAYNLQAALSGQRWKGEDIDGDTVNETVEKAEKLDIVQVARAISQDEIFRDKKNREELEGYIRYLETTKASIRRDVARAKKELPMPKRKYFRQAQEFFGHRYGEPGISPAPAFVFWELPPFPGEIFIAALVYFYLSSWKKEIVGFLKEKSRDQKWYSGPAFRLEKFLAWTLVDMTRYSLTMRIAGMFRKPPGLSIRSTCSSVENETARVKRAVITPLEKIDTINAAARNDLVEALSSLDKLSQPELAELRNEVERVMRDALNVTADGSENEALKYRTVNLAIMEALGRIAELPETLYVLSYIALRSRVAMIREGAIDAMASLARRAPPSITRTDITNRFLRVAEAAKDPYLYEKAVVWILNLHDDLTPNRLSRVAESSKDAQKREFISEAASFLVEAKEKGDEVTGSFQEKETAAKEKDSRDRMAEGIEQQTLLGSYGQIGSPEEVCEALFNDEGTARDFFDLATELRVRYPYDLSNDDPRPPLRYAMEEGLTVRIGEDLFLTPVTESFRRYLIFAKNAKGKVRFAFEVLLPGQEPSRQNTYAEKRGFIARKINVAFPGKGYSVVPIFEKEFPEGTYTMYGKEYAFGPDSPLRVIAFDYKYDGKRLDIRKPDVLRSIFKDAGISPKKARRSILEQLAEQVAAIHSIGYAGHGATEGEESDTDLHLGNFRIEAKKRRVKIRLVADFAEFKKLSEFADPERAIEVDYRDIAESAYAMPGVAELLDIPAGDVYEAFREARKNIRRTANVSEPVARREVPVEPKTAGKPSGRRSPSGPKKNLHRMLYNTGVVEEGEWKVVSLHAEELFDTIEKSGEMRKLTEFFGTIARWNIPRIDIEKEAMEELFETWQWLKRSEPESPLRVIVDEIRPYVETTLRKMESQVGLGDTRKYHDDDSLHAAIPFVFAASGTEPLLLVYLGFFTYSTLYQRREKITAYIRARGYPRAAKLAGILLPDLSKNRLTRPLHAVLTDFSVGAAIKAVDRDVPKRVRTWMRRKGRRSLRPERDRESVPSAGRPVKEPLDATQDVDAKRLSFTDVLEKRLNSLSAGERARGRSGVILETSIVPVTSHHLAAIASDFPSKGYFFSETRIGNTISHEYRVLFNKIDLREFLRDAAENMEEALKTEDLRKAPEWQDLMYDLGLDPETLKKYSHEKTPQMEITKRYSVFNLPESLYIAPPSGAIIFSTTANFGEPVWFFIMRDIGDKIVHIMLKELGRLNLSEVSGVPALIRFSRFFHRGKLRDGIEVIMMDRAFDPVSFMLRGYIDPKRGFQRVVPSVEEIRGMRNRLDDYRTEIKELRALSVLRAMLIEQDKRARVDEAKNNLRAPGVIRMDLFGMGSAWDFLRQTLWPAVLSAGSAIKNAVMYTTVSEKIIEKGSLEAPGHTVYEVEVLKGRFSGEVRRETIKDYRVFHQEGKAITRLHSVRVYGPGRSLIGLRYYGEDGSLERVTEDEGGIFSGQNAKWMDMNALTGPDVLKEALEGLLVGGLSAAEKEEFDNFTGAVFDPEVVRFLHTAAAEERLYPEAGSQGAAKIYGALKENKVPARIARYGTREVVEAEVVGITFVVDIRPGQFWETVPDSSDESIEEALAAGETPRGKGLIIMPKTGQAHLPVADIRFRDEAVKTLVRRLYDPEGGREFIFDSETLLVRDKKKGQSFGISVNADQIFGEKSMPRQETLLILGDFFDLTGNQELGAWYRHSSAAEMFDLSRVTPDSVSVYAETFLRNDDLEKLLALSEKVPGSEEVSSVIDAMLEKHFEDISEIFTAKPGLSYFREFMLFLSHGQLLGEDALKTVFHQNTEKFAKALAKVMKEDIETAARVIISLAKEDLFGKEKVRKWFIADPIRFFDLVAGIDSAKFEVLRATADKYPEFVSYAGMVMEKDMGEFKRAVDYICGINGEADWFLDSFCRSVGEDRFWAAMKRDPSAFSEVAGNIMETGVESFWAVYKGVAREIGENTMALAFLNSPTGFTRSIANIDEMKLENFLEWLSDEKKQVLKQAAREGVASELAVSYVELSETQKNILRGGLMLPSYVLYYKAIAGTLPAENKRDSCLYLASGSDYATAYMVSGGVREMIMVDRKPFEPTGRFSESELDVKKREYYRARAEQGYIPWYKMETKLGLKRNILWELEAMGAEIKGDPGYDSASGAYRVDFNLPGEEKGRSILYFQVDDLGSLETYPRGLLERISAGGVDSLVLKAAQDLVLPSKYTTLAEDEESRKVNTISREFIELIIESAGDGMVAFLDKKRWHSSGDGYFKPLEADKAPGKDIFDEIAFYQNKARIRFGYDGVSVMEPVLPRDKALRGSALAKDDEQTVFSEDPLRKEAERLERKIREEKEHAVSFAERLVWAQRSKAGKVDFIAVTRDWIDSHVQDHPQAQDLNLLMIAIRRKCEAMGIVFIEGDPENVRERVEQLKKENRNARGVVVTGFESMERFESLLAELGLDRDSNVVLAGVKTHNLDKGSYLRLVEILKIATVLLRTDIASLSGPAKADLESDNKKVGLRFTGTNMIVFDLPSSEVMPYEELRLIYRAQIYA